MKVIYKALLTLLLFAVHAAAWAQGNSYVLEGTVKDTDGQPIVGVAVIVRGGESTTTDMDGNYSIQVTKGANIEFACLGFNSKKVVINGQSRLDITLKEESNYLNELVVVGYGSQKKANLTGAVSVISSETLKDRSALDVGHMLQGSVPGLNITTSSGRPGQGVSVNIRGLNSINGGSPLVLVDGAEGNLLYINPADVESISVIKDAAAAAIYGARGSAGVILVTTKNGSKEKGGNATIRYSGRYGITTPTTSTDWESRGYYSVYLNNLFWEAYSPGTQYATYTDEDMQQLWIRRNDKTEDPARPWVVVDNRGGRDTYNYYANTDWWHVLYRDTKPTTSHTVTLSGATDTVNYLVSGGYTYEEGMFRESPDKYGRYNMRVKLSFDVAPWFKVGTNTSYFKSIYSYPGKSGVNDSFAKSTVHALASYPRTNPDGSHIFLTQYNGYSVMDGLMMLLSGNNKNEDNTDNISETFDVTITPFKGLSLKADYTYNLLYNRNVNRATNGKYSTFPGVIETIDTGDFEDKLTEKSSINIYQAANVYATWEKIWNDAHNFKIMAGVNYETKWLKDVTAMGYNMFSETLNDLDLTGSDEEGNKRTDVSGGQNEYRTAGYFARINYDFKDRYLFEANARYDGSSRFLRGSRWVFSPSVSLGWRISAEPFWENIKEWWNEAKIRASYGQLGNQQMSDYYPAIRTISTSGSSSYLLGGPKPSLATISAPVSSGLTWERSVQTNVGLDLSFFGSRLNVSLEGYIRDTKDMLTAGEPLPATYGYSTGPQENVADLRTKGYEISIDWNDHFFLAGRTFRYGIGLLFSDYVSHITKFNNPEKIFAKSYWEGMKYGDIWGYHVEGLFASDAEAAAWDVDQSIVNDLMTGGLKAGDLKFADLDGNKKIDRGREKVGDSGDWKVIGNSRPRFNYGVNLNASWNGFDIAAFFQGIGKMDWYPTTDARAFWGPYARPYETFIPRDFHTQYWTEDNPNAYFPRPRGYVALYTSRELGIANDRYLQNIGYLRLKNLTFGYTLPVRITQKVSISKLRIYFSGENLFYYCPGLHSKYIDPEMAMTQGNLRLYPWQKTFTFGIDITL